MRVRALIATLVALLAVPAPAQEQTAALRGIVRDSEGTPVQGVQVEARSARGLSLRGASDKEGTYRIVPVPPGTWEIALASDVLEGVSRTIELRAGETGVVDLVASPRPLSESISVEAPPPAVPRTDGSVTSTIAAEQFENLPSGRDYTSLVSFAPGVKEEVAAAGLAIFGSGGAENVFVLDGVEITDPRYGRSGKRVSTDVVDQLQVTSGAYSAEFPSATGGVINVVTRSGSNELLGWVDSVYSTNDWGGDTRPVLGFPAGAYTLPEVDESERAELGLSIAGPIVRDRAWYFLLAQPERETTDRRVGLEGQPTDSYERKTTAENYALNLTGAPASKFLFRAAANWSGYDRDDLLANVVPYLETEIVDYTLADELKSETFSGYAEYLASSRMSISLRGGRFVNDYRESGRPSSPSAWFGGDMTAFPEIPPELLRPSGYSTVSNYQVDQEKYVRDDIALQARFQLNGRGYHELVAGIQANNVEADLEWGLQSLYYGYYWDGSFLGGDENRGTYGSMIVVRWRVSGHSESLANAFFLQDQWTASDGRLTVNAGLRVEEEKIPSFADPALGFPEYAIEFDFGDKLAPRLGFSWGVTEDQRWNLHGGYGTFYDRMKLDLPIRLFGGEKSAYYHFRLQSYEWPNILCTGINGLPADTPTCVGADFIELEYSPPVNDPDDLRVDPDLEPMETREWSLGLSNQATNDTLLGVTYLHRELVRAFEDVGIVTDNPDGTRTFAYHIANPGFGIAREPSSGAPPMPRAERGYDAIILEATSRPASRWWLRGAYTWSRLEGNYGGVQATAGPTGGYTSGFADSVATAYDASGHPTYGPLENDRTHQFTMQTYYGPIAGFTFGLNQYAGSGTPVSTLLRYRPPDISSTSEFFPEGRGDLGRTPTLTQTDLLLRYDLGLPRGVVLRATVDVLNLFDEDTETSVIGLYSTQPLRLSEEEFYGGFDWEAKAAKLPKNARFGKAATFQSPREIRAGIRLSF